MLKRRSTKNSSRRTAELTNLVSASIRPKVGSTRLAADQDLRALGLQMLPTARPIQFGSPSSSSITSSQGSGGLLSNLLSSGSSSVVSGLIGGGLFGFLGKSLVAGLGGLFAPSKQEFEPLSRFSLPESQNIAVDVAQSRIFDRPAAAARLNVSRGYSDRNTEILRTVKQALLTSNQLNDIISEL